jgi:hypothetical protein
MQTIESNAAFQKNLFLKIATCAFLISMFSLVLSNNIADLDLWHEMALIRESIALGHIPLKDHFAYTPTLYPSVQHEWGAGAIAYFLGTQFGPSGILAAKYLLASMIVMFFLLCIRKRKVSGEVLIFLAPIGIELMSRSFATARAQMYSFAFVACLLWVFELEQNENRRWFVFWIPLYLIWINLHGGFLVGIGLLGAFWFERLLRRKPHLHLILAGVAMVGLIAVNPYGLSYYSYLWRAMTMARPYIAEWHPIWRGSPPLQVSMLLLSLILVIYSVMKTGIRKADGLAVLFATALATIFCVRLIFFYALVWTTYVSGYLQRTPLGNLMNDLYKKLPKFFIPILCIAAVAIFVRTLSYHPWELLVPSDHIKKYGDHPIYPVGPVQYLKEVDFKGNLMVFFDWGSYVTWKLYPNVRVSMDSRYEVAYPEWLVKENIQFYMGKEGWERTLDKYPTDLVLVRKGLPLAKVIPQSKWNRVYTDKVFELYACPGLTLPVVNWTDRDLKGTFP